MQTSYFVQTFHVQILNVIDFSFCIMQRIMKEIRRKTGREKGNH